MKQPDLPELWLKKAESDLKMAEYASSTEASLWDQACFHSQQVAEKAIKPNIPEKILEAAEELNAYAVLPRYPSFLASETEADARHAIDSARSVLSFVLSVV